MDITLYITPLTVAMCMVLGKIIKSSKLFNKLDNNWIPVILVLFGIGFQLFMYGLTKDNGVSGFLSAVVSVGLHQQGKTLYTTLSSTNTDDAIDDIEG